MQRIDQSDLIYKNEEAKFGQVVEDIVERHANGQPVLVGTTSVEKSEYLSRLLAKKGVRHEVLNAKNHAREAAIVAQAGRLGSVTVATNMAGRGTDVMLGGNAEFLAVAAMNAKGLSPVETPDEYEKEWDDVFAAVKAEVSEEADKVIAAGGLYVLGTERHESRRIDNQLRGRSGRQGDPGESRFYLSLTDDLMRLFNAGAAESLMGRQGIPDDMAIESKVVSRAIRSAQAQVEGRNAEIRKNVLKYDDVLNRQREAIYGDRRHILEGDDLHERTQRFLEDVVDEVLEVHTGEGNGDDWDFDALWTELKTLYPVGLTIDEVVAEAGNRGKINRDFMRREILSDAKVAYLHREESLGSPAMRELERRVVLSASCSTSRSRSARPPAPSPVPSSPPRDSPRPRPRVRSSATPPRAIRAESKYATSADRSSRPLPTVPAGRAPRLPPMRRRRTWWPDRPSAARSASAATTRSPFRSIAPNGALRARSSPVRSVRLHRTMEALPGPRAARTAWMPFITAGLRVR